MKVATRKKKLLKRVIVEVVRAKQVSPFKVKIQFSDGASRTINFQRFLEASTNPLIRAFLDPKRFGQFMVRDGDLMWGDFELCFPIADLYEGTI